MFTGKSGLPTPEGRPGRFGEGIYGVPTPVGCAGSVSGLGRVSPGWWVPWSLAGVRAVFQGPQRARGGGRCDTAPPRPVLLRICIYCVLLTEDTALCTESFGETAIGPVSGLMWKEGEQTDMWASSCHPCSQYSRKAAVLICLFPFLVMLDEIWLSLKKGICAENTLWHALCR